jgi:hypothetical protein
MLAPRVPAAQEADHHAMGALRDRLDLAHSTLSDFKAAIASLRRRRDIGRAEFEAASARFLDVVINVLGARSHSLRHLTTTWLAEEDWRQIADITPAFLEAEAQSFARVGELAPPGMKPEQMSTGERPAAAGSHPA